MELEQKPEDQALVTAIIAMAHALGLKVVAEGVENRAQLNLLATKQCDMVQGFLFSRPEPQISLKKQSGI
jgi:EAL domain-containing protein (putative c-di-GMP-specific phosphodiesterase class I)